MAAHQTNKNKWNSQQIQKRCKNKHHTSPDDLEWNKMSNHSNFLTNYCNEYVKNVYTNYNDDNAIEIMDEYELNLHQPSYWRCNQCTYAMNKESDLYCSICESHFNSSSIQNTSNITNNPSSTITFGDYLPSTFQDAVHTEDDIDESIQIAIFMSYENIPPQTQDIDIYSNEMYTFPLTTNKAGHRQKRKKRQQNTEKLTTEQRTERRRIRAYIAKCLRICRNLQTMINADILHSIKRRTTSVYGQNRFVSISLIAKPSNIKKFAVDGVHDGDLEMVYHGTDAKNAQSIIDNGLIVGGTKGVPIKHGRAYGTGIYCSPNMSTARGYEKGSLFVCCIKPKKVNKSGHIYVVPNEQDIVPLYVLSFERDGPYKETPVKYLPNNRFEQKWRESLKEKKAREFKHDYDGQNVVRFIPSFLSLNKREKFKRKMRRKWSAYYKINGYKSCKK